MSDCFDHAGMAWDSLIDGDQQDEPDCPSSYLPSAPKKVTCTRCGKQNLTWVKTELGWKLLTKKHKVHDCTKRLEKLRKQRLRMRGLH